ncbi:contact-dependent growth inhibition system immunity protein [Streptomyces sp. B1866]|uniref:contact-dependent growth inhibition system immunity protein n=1 Tax=Streptomyces sp. B1866 TaxID=3075431 RepID=UPI00289037F3|nr:contact-dependent growth inhibition system immunity protein [Streptomyces sp. B1866]MDT3400651.1 contact-dependent growth inhibition system immunity protein [Streptomyces sp. B1866]
MDSSSPPGHRFAELQNLLAFYTQAGFVFSDTPTERGPALDAYLRVCARDPQRAAQAVREIDDLLTVGLFSEEISDDVDLMPRVRPTGGRNVEESLRIARDHIDACLRDRSLFPVGRPQMGLEWYERFPGLRHLLGAYFHQDHFDEYSSDSEAVEDYLRGTPQEDITPVLEEVPELLAMVESEEDLDRVTTALGSQVSPPDGLTYRQWITSLADIIRQHLSGKPAPEEPS